MILKFRNASLYHKLLIIMVHCAVPCTFISTHLLYKCILSSGSNLPCEIFVYLSSSPSAEYSMPFRSFSPNSRPTIFSSFFPFLAQRWWRRTCGLAQVLLISIFLLYLELTFFVAITRGCQEFNFQPSCKIINVSCK